MKAGQRGGYPLTGGWEAGKELQGSYNKPNTHLTFRS